jgi:diadenosine tetraphosphate (Ap4A) HIT family hydrolase
MRNERLKSLMIEICEMNASTLFLFRNQVYRGRCIVASNRHVDELFQLTPGERETFMADVARAAQALYSAFEPDKINYGAFGDTMPHLHVHLVPKYQHGPNWGGMFEMNPQPAKVLSEAGYQATCELIRNHL